MSFAGLKGCVENHNYTTELATSKLLDIPSNITDKYGKQSVKYNYIINQNKFKKTFLM